MEVAVLSHASALRRAVLDRLSRPLPPPWRSALRRGAGLAGLALLASIVPVFGQTARVSVDSENFRLEPQGKVLAKVNRGTAVAVVDRQGSWREVVLSGWIWAPSVAATHRDGFDLLVSADGGENLRAEPGADARVVARLLEGLLLQKTGQQGNWIHVRRTAWIWGPSLSEASGGSAASDSAGRGGAANDGSSAGASLPDHLVVKGSPARLFVSPSGDTMGVARPGADLQVLERKGEWTRVRLEGWVRSSAVTPADSAASGSEITAADLRANPDQYVGRVVRWNVQFISLEKAEAVRTDFYEGEPFILARSPGASESFLYLAVPPELLPQVKALRPLQSIQVVARVRTGRSALMGAPILNLLEIH